MQFDAQWLAQYIGNMVLECAATRGTAAQQIADKDREIAALKKAADLADTAFAQANQE